MKLLTLNTHSLVEENFEEKALHFADALLREHPDVIALQEVNQRCDAPLLTHHPDGMISCGGERPLREDLYVYWLSNILAEGGLRYFWTWLPLKRGYGYYDEGLAFLCRTPIVEVRTREISRPRRYEDWRRRMVLMIRAEGMKGWFCNLHAGWWADPEDPFSEQWERLNASLTTYETVYLMGDLNNPAERRGEGYDQISSHGFFDSYCLAKTRRGGGTVGGEIDGWRERDAREERLRIDQIWCNRPCVVSSYRTVFDGEDYGVVSDHFGVMITVEEKEEKR